MSNKSPVYAVERFPFDVDYQKSLLRLLCEDDSFAHSISKYLQPQYFENEILAWALAVCQRHESEYGGFPALHTLKNQVRQLDPNLQPVYQATIEQVELASLKDSEWMRDATLDFVKRNIFVRSYHESRNLYNSGKIPEAFDLMMERMTEIQRATWEPVNRSWYFDDLPRRQNKRMNTSHWDQCISTGMPWLDEVLDGGLSIGELGVWVAYAKGGKSVMLKTLGVAATRFQMRNTLHIILEGSREMLEDRYDSEFMNELYTNVKHGSVDSNQYTKTWQEFQKLKGKLVIRAFTETWDYTILDIDNELKELWRQHGWRPDLIIIDYGDLLKGRDKNYPSENEKQKAAFRDIKSLANRGYAIWTASQARRPEKGSEDRAHWIFTREIADCFEKVRIADYLGTLNSTRLERQYNVLRAMAELYRGGPADKRIALYCDLPHMIIRQQDGVQSPCMPDLTQIPSLGYTTPVVGAVSTPLPLKQQKVF